MKDSIDFGHPYYYLGSSVLRFYDFGSCSGVSLETPMRLNQKDRKSFPKVFGKARKRIETLFLQLCDQFLNRRNYAKSFTGFAMRIIAKIAVLTIIQLYNQLAGKNIYLLKSGIS